MPKLKMLAFGENLDILYIYIFIMNIFETKFCPKILNGSFIHFWIVTSDCQSRD